MLTPNTYWNHDENTWGFCFVHLVEVQNHLESRCREPFASPTIGHNETGEQAALKYKSL
jgi:hypothetical protein